jgi:hypothetical protein
MMSYKMAIRLYAPDNHGGWFIDKWYFQIVLPGGWGLMVGIFKNKKLPFFMKVDE